MQALQDLSSNPLGWGALVAAIAYLIRQIGTALAKRAEAQRLAAHADDVTAETVRKFMDEMRGRVAKAEADTLRSRQLLEECEQKHAEALGLVAALRREVDELRDIIQRGKAESLLEESLARATGADGAPPIPVSEEVRRARGDQR